MVVGIKVMVLWDVITCGLVARCGDVKKAAKFEVNMNILVFLDGGRGSSRMLIWFELHDTTSQKIILIIHVHLFFLSFMQDV